MTFNSKNASTMIAAAIIILGLASVLVLSSRLEVTRAAVPAEYADSDLALQGRRLKGFALGFEGLLADWYWMRSLQYIGDKMIGKDVNIDDLREFGPRLLYPYLDNATDLDPQFIAPYSYGAIVLPAIDPEQAIKLSEKAIVNNPDNWRLYNYLGYIHWRLQRFDEAAKVYERGAKAKDAPEFMHLMAAMMKSEGGSRETAREMYRQLLSLPENDPIRNTAELRLLQIDSLYQIDAINELLKRSGSQCPKLTSIIPALAQIKLPKGTEFHIDAENNIVDPSGTPYELDTETCTVSHAKTSPLA